LSEIFRTTYPYSLSYDEHLGMRIHGLKEKYKI